jgi:DnaJ family protein C protein 11
LNAITIFPPKDHGILAYSIAIPRLKPSNYNVRSSFKIPLPQHANAELKINTGIGGPLSRLRREIEYKTETGEKETRPYLMPVSIFARSITLGASGSFIVPGAILPSILNFFQGCEIEAGAALFPAPVLRTSVARSLTPLKGALPSRVSLQTIYRENIMRMPPIVDINVSRRLGPRQFADIGWSSGMWFWPSILQTSFGRFIQVGIREDDIIPVTSYSSCRVGFTSYSAVAPPPDETSKQSHAASDSTDHTNLGKLSPLGEAWGLELTSSPFGAAVSVSYGRNLFRGHVRTPLRSEWSQVGYHKNEGLPLSRPQAVRLDLQGSLSLDGTIGWMVQGSRGVGEFTRVGLGVGVQGPRGLVFSITYNRLGQSINLPVVICPLGLVNIDIIAASIAIPWTLYTAFHYGYLLPRERRRHSEALKKRRGELETLVQARRSESRRNVELMAGRVRRRQALEMENHGLVVLEARYGTIGPAKSNANATALQHEMGSMIDVTIPVAGLVHQSQLNIARGVNKVSCHQIAQDALHSC